jgi:alpha-beta hydrolase superfamily lysophospholipase
MRPILSMLLACAAFAGTAGAADYPREERWAHEVVPALVVGEPVWLATPARPKVLAIVTAPAGTSRGGVVLVHGVGVHPDFGTIGTLRSALADAGFTTLSVQMPVLAADADRDAYPATFPEAAGRLDAAVAWLREHGSAKVAVVSHSMGAAMTNAWLAGAGAPRIDAWVPIGMAGAFAAPPAEPVLDVLAATELEAVKQSAPARPAKLPRDACSRQLTVGGADHYFESQQRELAAIVVGFLERAFGGRC